MPRPRLPLGTWGEIRSYAAARDDDGKPTAYRAIAKYRDFDGRSRTVERWGKSDTAARNNLRTALKDRAALAWQGELSAASYFRDALTLWLERFEELVRKEERSPGSLDTYRHHADKYVLPALGELRLGEMTTPLLDKVIRRISTEVGSPTAKTCRSIVSGVLGLAVRYGALTHNPTREVDRVSGKARKEPRALTMEERVAWLAQLDADEDAVNRDVPDLCRLMLATGARIGEALAVLWSDVDFQSNEVTITSTIIRVKAVGLVRKPTKTEAGERTLRLPRWAMQMLEQRHLANPWHEAPVFPATTGSYRDPSNTLRDLRNARGTESFAWVTSHNFRKTAATILDEAGLTAREIADQLGHARPSMTQDVYLGRKATNSRAAAVLQDAFDTDAQTKSVGKAWDGS